mmetsp:Transcript_14257/g.39074  ORF Transcript_14257/g.39074 Transcript_14257/m.39074 type:complete len:277 (-) Transcript_14257:507-1337(-)
MLFHHGDVARHVELAVHPPLAHVAHHAEDGRLLPRPVVVAEDPGHARVAVGVAAIKAVLVVEVKKPLEPLLRRWRPLEHLLPPVHAHVVCHLASHDNLLLGRVPHLVLCCAILELLERVLGRPLVLLVLLERLLGPGGQAGEVVVLALEVAEVEGQLPPHDRLLDEALLPRLRALRGHDGHRRMHRRDVAEVVVGREVRGVVHLGLVAVLAVVGEPVVKELLQLLLGGDGPPHKVLWHLGHGAVEAFEGLEEGVDGALLRDVRVAGDLELQPQARL